MTKRSLPIVGLETPIREAMKLIVAEKSPGALVRVSDGARVLAWTDIADAADKPHRYMTVADILSKGANFPVEATDFKIVVDLGRLDDGDLHMRLAIAPNYVCPNGDYQSTQGGVCPYCPGKVPLVKED